MSAYRFSLLEPGQEPQLMKAMKAIFEETAGHNAERYDLDYWKWQYRQLPTGKSIIAVAWRDDEIVGYYHIPIYDCIIDGQPRRIGNVQDVAMAAECRGKGTFKDLAIFANKMADDSPDIDLIYTFPNHRSIRTFLKYNGYSRLITYPTYVLPLSARGILGRKIPVIGHAFGICVDFGFSIFSLGKRLKGKVQVSEVANDAIGGVYKFYGSNYSNHLIRDESYLNWRYAQCPRGRHWFFSSVIDRRVVASLVVKQDIMINNRALVLMDFGHLEGFEQELLALINHTAKGHVNYGIVQCNLLFYSGQSSLNGQFWKLGFVNIPEKANPRPLNLLVRPTGREALLCFADPKRWFVNLGDWDVL